MNGRVDERLNHLDEMTGLLYLEGQLEPAKARQVSAHAEECPACRVLLRAMERESRLLKRAMVEEDEELPLRLHSFTERAANSLQWIWAAAVGLAATGAYALYTGYIEPWQQQLSQAGFGGTSLLSLLVFQGAFWKGWQSMFSMLEFVALATVGTGAVVFLRRKIRRTSAAAMILAGLCAVAAAFPEPAGAIEIRKDQNYTLGKDEVIKSDLFLTCGRGRIDGTVDGDLIVFAEGVDVSGHVTGDVIAFARTLRIMGQVDGNVRAFTNTTTISGSVGKNIIGMGDVLNLDPGAKVGGSATLLTGSLSLDGRVGRDLWAFFPRATLNGFVGGNARLKGKELNIGPSADLQGKVRFEGHQPATVSPQAKLALPVEFVPYSDRADSRTGKYYLWKVIWTAATLLFGMVMFLLMPGFAREAVDSGQKYWVSPLLGILVFFGVPIAAIFACFTVVGIPIAIGALGVWGAVFYCAQFVVGGILGKSLLGPTSDMWGLIGRMALGLVAVRILFLIPKAGFWFGLIVFIWGIGAISLAIYRRFTTAAPVSAAA